VRYVVSGSGEPSSSRSRTDIFVQRGREAVGHGHRNKEGSCRRDGRWTSAHARVHTQSARGSRRRATPRRRPIARGGVTAVYHLCCADCRIRVRAADPHIALLEGRCPVCGGVLRPLSSAEEALGLRSFDLSPLSESGSRRPPPAPGPPADLAARRAAALARDAVEVDRWSDEGGSVVAEAFAELPAAP